MRLSIESHSVSASAEILLELELELELESLQLAVVAAMLEKIKVKTILAKSRTVMVRSKRFKMIEQFPVVVRIT